MRSVAVPSSRLPSLVLGLIIASATVTYTLLTWLCFMPAWLPRARVSLGTITGRTLSGAIVFTMLGLTLFALYTAGAILLWRTAPSRGRTILVWIGAVIASVILLWAYPVTSTDVFDYLFRARMTLVYHANPYLTLPRDFPDDPLLRYVGWPNAPSAYGPLWELISMALLRISGNQILTIVIAYKLLMVAAYLLCGAAIQALIRDPRVKLLGTYLWLWSPLTLWEFAAVGHNDAFLALSLLLALLAVQHNRHGAAIVALTGGTLIKFLPALALPLVVLHWMRRQPTWTRRIAVAAFSVVAFAVLMILFYAPYWDVPSNFGSLSWGDRLRAIWHGRVTTLRNVSVRANFLNASPMAVVSYLLQTPTSVRVINEILTGSRWIADTQHIRSAISSLESVLLVIGLAWQCWHLWFRGRTPARALWGLLLWYLLIGSQWFQPWYLTWLLALLAIAPSRTTFAWLTAWQVTAQASYLLQFIVLPNLKISGQTLGAQQAYLLLIYVLPLCVWLAIRIIQRRRDVDPPRAEARMLLR